MEGWALPPEPTYDVLPEGRPAHEADRVSASVQSLIAAMHGSVNPSC